MERLLPEAFWQADFLSRLSPIAPQSLVGSLLTRKAAGFHRSIPYRRPSGLATIHTTAAAALSISLFSCSTTRHATTTSSPFVAFPRPTTPPVGHQHRLICCRCLSATAYSSGGGGSACSSAFPQPAAGSAQLRPSSVQNTIPSKKVFEIFRESRKKVAGVSYCTPQEKVYSRPFTQFFTSYYLGQNYFPAEKPGAPLCSRGPPRWLLCHCSQCIVLQSPQNSIHTEQ